jgi:hypothetical protein
MDKAQIFGIKKSTGYFIVIHGDDDFFTKDFFFDIRKLSSSCQWIVGRGYYINTFQNRTHITMVSHAGSL